MIVLTILFGLIGLGIIIFIHELGHFIGAKANGIEVETFSLGWGKKLAGFKRGTTNYQIAWFPIGGYCKMKGESLKSTLTEEELDNYRHEKGSFLAARPWRRAIVLLSGPLFNIIFAILIISFIWWVGFKIYSWDNRIILASDYEEPYREYPADRAGLKTGDRIISVNGNPIENFFEIAQAISQSEDGQLTVKVERFDDFTQKSTTLDLRIQAEKNQENQQYQIGIHAWIEPIIGEVEKGKAAFLAGLMPGDRILTINGNPIRHNVDAEHGILERPEVVDITYLRDGIELQTTVYALYDKDGNPEYGFSFEMLVFQSPRLNLFQSLRRGVSTSFEILSLSLQVIVQLLQFQTEDLDVAGPVRLTKELGESATSGFRLGVGTGLVSFFQILSFLSVAIAFMNLLPIPILDGGQLLLTLWEAIRRKPIKARVIFRLQIVGFVIVLALLVVAIFGDIIFIVDEIKK